MNEQRVIKSFLLADAEKCQMNPERKDQMLQALLAMLATKPQPA